MSSTPVSADDKNLIVLTHILPLIIGFCIPLSGFLVPLIILFTSKNELVKNHSKIALNWQLSSLIYIIVSLILVFLLIGLILVPIVLIMGLVFPIVAAIKVNEDATVLWPYPLSIPFFSVDVAATTTSSQVVDAETVEKDK